MIYFGLIRVKCLTENILFVLRYQGLPVLPLWFLDVYVEEAVPRSVQVRLESKNLSLVGDIGILGLEVVHKFDPWEQT